MMGLFGRTRKDPREHVRKLQRKMRSEINSINQQIHAIQREEEKVKAHIKAAAKKNDRDVCVILAKSIIQSKKAVSKLYVTRTQINSVILNMQNQLAVMRVAGPIQQSTEIMRTMQQLVKVPEIMQTMRDMSKEMTRVGIMEEIIEETFESMEPEELGEQAQEEVDKVLWEVTAGEMGKAPSAPIDATSSRAVSADIASADDFIRQIEADERN